MTVRLADVDIGLAWNVRGDATHPPFAAEAERVLGLPLPLPPRRVVQGSGIALIGLAPRAWLLLGGQPRGDGESARRALDAVGGALFDVSSSYVGWSIAGDEAGRVLNRGCPLDFHPSVFPPGSAAQSVFGHVNALLYRPDESARFVLLVARSFAREAWHGLREAALCDGFLVASNPVGLTG